jgi:hypothetical protein
MVAFQIVQIIFWLALATWFGAVLFVAVAAPVVFRTVREANPILPGVLSVNMEGQHGTLLAGTIVSNLLTQLRPVQAICAAVLALSAIAQLFLIDLSGPNGTAAAVRAGLLLVAAATLLFDWLAVAPKLAVARQAYLDHADEPDLANPARDTFEVQHRRSVSALQVLLFCLLGMILFSASTMPRSRSAVPIGGGSVVPVAVPSDAPTPVNPSR